MTEGVGLTKKRQEAAGFHMTEPAALEDLIEVWALPKRSSRNTFLQRHTQGAQMKKLGQKSAPTQESVPGRSCLAICALECTRKEPRLGPPGGPALPCQALRESLASAHRDGNEDSSLSMS